MRKGQENFLPDPQGVCLGNDNGFVAKSSRKRSRGEREGKVDGSSSGSRENDSNRNRTTGEKVAEFSHATMESEMRQNHLRAKAQAEAQAAIEKEKRRIAMLDRIIAAAQAMAARRGGRVLDFNGSTNMHIPDRDSVSNSSPSPGLIPNSNQNFDHNPNYNPNIFNTCFVNNPNSNLNLNLIPMP